MQIVLGVIAGTMLLGTAAFSQEGDTRAIPMWGTTQPLAFGQFEAVQGRDAGITLTRAAQIRPTVRRTVELRPLGLHATPQVGVDIAPIDNLRIGRPPQVSLEVATR